MSIDNIVLTAELSEYIRRVSLREHPVLKQLREETARDPAANMQISAEQGQFMALLAKLMHARNYIEIGVFTGYSSLSVALVLPEDGHILACDINPVWTDAAKRYWEQAGVADKITLHLAPAIETLDTLLSEGTPREFDLAFIDADKENYLAYYERILKLLRPGGLIMADNTLWGGSVVDAARCDSDTIGIRKFNDAVFADHRVDISLVPIGDGLTLARKK